MTMHASSSILNPPAHTKRRSVLRQFIEAVIEGRRRKAAHELALYLEHHKHSLKDDVRIELENRLRGRTQTSPSIHFEHRGLPPLCVISAVDRPVRSVFRTSSLPQGGTQVLGANLKCSESRCWPRPQCASSQSRIAHGERLDGHVEEGCSPSRLYVFMSGQRGAFSVTR